MPRKDVRPRLRLGVETRTDAILAAATECFSRSSYSDVSVADIARIADASEALVYRYFGTKSALYARLVAQAVHQLADAQREAVAALHPNTPVQAKVRAALGVYLDHVATHPRTWAAGYDASGEPPEATAIRATAQRAYVDALAQMLRPNPGVRHHYALWGAVGFLNAACLEWVRGGCPPSDRGPVIEASLGALEGALGDWAA